MVRQDPVCDMPAEYRAAMETARSDVASLSATLSGLALSAEQRTQISDAAEGRFMV